MIFVDHIPNDILNKITLHNFGFSDAAEVFVLLAGFSATLAYGRSFERDGAISGLRRVALRCARIYVFQIGLLLATLAVVVLWTRHYHLQATIVAPILGKPVAGLAHGLTLRALPSYLDILPLYVVLLAAFPAIYLVLRRSRWLALAGSAGLWAVANLDHGLNLPNWIDGQGWYFNPFAWQFLFTIGAAMAVTVARNGGALPWLRGLAALCAVYLVVAFFEAAPWGDWSLPDLRLFAMEAPDKSHLAVPRILDILALIYLLLSSERVRSLARHALLRPVEACGRHSLEVFSVGCMLSLFGRLVFRTYGVHAGTQVLVNLLGFGTMFFVGLWLERGRAATDRRVPAVVRLQPAGRG
jgi:hypothetical protein